ncbi:MAG: hypothetical protein ABIJ96_02920 [Elusimicrobiota bacterium]
MPTITFRRLLILLALEAVCFGPYLFSTGFYLDDYVFLHYVIADVGPGGTPDLAAGIRSFAAGGFWNRPAEILHYPLLIWLGGMKPWLYRCVGLALELLLGVFMFLTFRRISGDGCLALLAGVFALAYPNHTVTHVWMTASAPVASFVLVFASLALHGRALARRDKRAAVGAQALFLFALLEYEAVAFFPVLFVAARIARRGVARSVRESWHYAATLAAAMLYLRGFATLLIEEPTRPVRLSLEHFAAVYHEALACATTRPFGLFLDALAGDAAALGLAARIALLVAAAGLAYVIGRERRAAPVSRDGAFALLAAAAALFVVSYIPYALTGTYMPRIVGVMNRLNHGGGIAAGMALAAGCGLMPGRWRGLPLRTGAVTAALALMITVQWDAGHKWSEAWSLQRRTVEDIRAELPAGPATVVLAELPSSYHGATIFRTSYDITRALWYAVGRKDIRGDWALSGRYDDAALVVVNGQGMVSRYPYENLYIYDGRKRRLFSVTGKGRVSPIES